MALSEEQPISLIANLAHQNYVGINALSDLIIRTTAGDDQQLKKELEEYFQERKDYHARELKKLMELNQKFGS